MYHAAAHRHKPLLLSMYWVFYFWYSSIILTGLWASIGVTRSYSNHLFLCALASLQAQVGWQTLKADTKTTKSDYVGRQVPHPMLEVDSKESKFDDFELECGGRK